MTTISAILHTHMHSSALLAHIPLLHTTCPTSHRPPCGQSEDNARHVPSPHLHPSRRHTRQLPPIKQEHTSSPFAATRTSTVRREREGRWMPHTAQAEPMDMEPRSDTDSAAPDTRCLRTGMDGSDRCTSALADTSPMLSCTARLRLRAHHPSTTKVRERRKIRLAASRHVTGHSQRNTVGAGHASPLDPHPASLA